MLPAAFDDASVASGKYGVTGTPTVYVLDAEGRILWRRFGYRPGDDERLRGRVEAALAAAPAS